MTSHATPRHATPRRTPRRSESGPFGPCTPSSRSLAWEQEPETAARRDRSRARDPRGSRMEPAALTVPVRPDEAVPSGRAPAPEPIHSSSEIQVEVVVPVYNEADGLAASI